MSAGSSFDDLRETVRSLYATVGHLEEMYPGRHFTLDGHLVGSLGEVYAKERYGLTLYEASYPVHDAHDRNWREVQIKCTQGTRVAISSEPQYLIVLKLDKNGEFEEVYNGSGKPVWKLFDHRKRPKNGQFQTSLAKLRELNARVPDEERIAPV